MSDTAWLFVAVGAAALLAIFWVKRELWIHRRRRRARTRSPERK